MKKIVIALALLLLPACGTPSEVKDKIALEAAIHVGYERLIEGASRDDLILMIRTSGAAWSALDLAVNGDAGVAASGSATDAAVTTRTDR